MSRHSTDARRQDVARTMWRVAVVTLAAAAWGTIASPAGAAGAIPARHASPHSSGGDGHSTNLNTGHASRNRNYAAVNSPTVFHGNQNVSISISHKTITQGASCRKHARICRINQNGRID
ncbi:hypothetical protein [Microbispora sp. NPDC049125]|uniref:hypothetical protein n=1 Tax=Microbispora sp. NPDC049125 TaxID=3154929 RepID=UPI0034651677